MAVPPKDDLGKDVLRDVSRSFYLTLRALPKGMREATSVGYLLARASDTIADCGGAREARIALLQDFRSAIADGAGETFLHDASLITEDEALKEGERVLMRRLGEVFAWAENMQDWEQKAVRKVVTIITEGQLWDLERFPEGELVEIEEASEAEQYCYQVAGCVGEFWTEIGFGSNSRFANKSQEAMMNLGKDYGKGLQLINILRDQSEDAERGRKYLPGELSVWTAKAQENLQAGLEYSRAVRGWRARFATVLPALIGLETLSLFESASPEERAQGVKVSRKVVKSCLRKALFFR